MEQDLRIPSFFQEVPGASVRGGSFEPREGLSQIDDLDDRLPFPEDEDEFRPLLLLEGDPVEGSRGRLQGEALLADEGGHLPEVVVEGLEGVQEVGSEELPPSLRVEGIQDLGEGLLVLTRDGEDPVSELCKFNPVYHGASPNLTGDSRTRNRAGT